MNIYKVSINSKTNYIVISDTKLNAALEVATMLKVSLNDLYYTIVRI
jgi:hypothetical protein